MPLARHREFPTHDIGVMQDEGSNTSFLIYSQVVREGATVVRESSYRIVVQQLSADGRHGVPGALSKPFGARPCEAPVLFRSPSRYFAVFGKNCWCCAQGAEAYVFSAAHPLGPWEFRGDINHRSRSERNDGIEEGGSGSFLDSGDAGRAGNGSRRVVAGQTAFVQRVSGPGPEHGRYFLAFDLWMTGTSRATQVQAHNARAHHLSIYD